MATSTKHELRLSIGRTPEEHKLLVSNLREIAANTVGKGRYGGNLSLLLERIAQLEASDRELISLILKKFLQEG